MNPLLTYRHLDTEDDIASAYAVMYELRPHLPSPAAFAAQVVRQQEHGYRLLAACADGVVIALAGYRTTENLLYGAFIYVDDLVVTEAHRCASVGSALLDAVREIAVELGCAHFVLDTGLHMPLAQRFYFRQGLLARGMHFVQPLGDSAVTKRSA